MSARVTAEKRKRGPSTAARVHAARGRDKTARVSGRDDSRVDYAALALAAEVEVRAEDADENEGGPGDFAPAPARSGVRFVLGGFRAEGEALDFRVVRRGVA